MVTWRVHDLQRLPQKTVPYFLLPILEKISHRIRYSVLILPPLQYVAFFFLTYYTCYLELIL